MSGAAGKSPGFDALRRAWRGEIGLYGAAYAFGGLGLAIAGLVGDSIAQGAAATGGSGASLICLAIGAMEIAAAFVSVVATWRAARLPRSDGRRHGPIAIGCAFVFVGLNAALIGAWAIWTVLAGFGLARVPGEVVLDALVDWMGGDSSDIGILLKTLVDR